jgi:polar amino acid transport system permease protein
MRELGPNEILFILAAVRWTLLLSITAFLGGAMGGVPVALVRTSEFRWMRLTATGYIKIFQGTPLLMQLFLAFFVPGLFGWSVDP